MPDETNEAEVAPGEASPRVLNETNETDETNATKTVDLADKSDAEAIRRMVQAARVSENVGQLRRNPQLDTLAREHAEAMRATGVAAHDVGQGDAADRARRANVDFRLLGENFARATSPETAHRALWRSPAHRSTLLDPRFHEFGVAAVRSADGTIWVCQLFATLAR